MNQFEGPGSGEAKIKFLDADFQVLSAGSYVRCGYTGKPIPIEELKYWSVERQEAYLDIAASVAASNG